MSSNKLHLDQYYNEIFLKNMYSGTMVEIRYSGSIVADLLVDGHVFMTNNKIIIVDIGTLPESTLIMRYRGNLKIKRIFDFDEGVFRAGGIRHRFDEIENINSQIDTASFKYEDMNKTNRYYPGMTSLISYEYKKMKNYATPRGKGIRFFKKLKKEALILNSLKAKRG